MIIRSHKAIAHLAPIELLALTMHNMEQHQNRLKRIDQNFNWFELTPDERDEYRNAVIKLLAEEYPD